MRAYVLALGLAAAPLVAGEPALPPGMKIDRIVVLMRHGVRPPTKMPAMPAGIASEEWPRWGVPPGHLTHRGAAAVRIVAAYDRKLWQAGGLLPRRGCLNIRVIADSDQRTIATAEQYAAALAPGCEIGIDHRPEGEADPRFSAIDEGAVPFDAAIARQAVLADAGPDGIATEDQRLRPVLARLDAILCGGATAACGVSKQATALAPSAPGKRPKLTGAIDRGSTAAQILLLEYADGKPLAEVGWGRAGPSDVAALSALHAAEFRLLARPRYIARANLGLLRPVIEDGLSGSERASVTMISGHDTNVANLGGLLGLHWQVPGLAADDPSPGGAIILERLRDRAGRSYVRALYRSQTLEQIRHLTPLATAHPYAEVLPIVGCEAAGVKGLCTAEMFAGITR